MDRSEMACCEHTSVNNTNWIIRRRHDFGTFNVRITHLLGVCINFKGDGITSTIASGIILLLSSCSKHHHVTLVSVILVSFCQSVNNIVFLSIEYVEFCANKTQFAGIFAFLLPFEEKCCWKSTNANRKLMMIIQYYRFQHMSTCFDAI